MVMVDSAMTDCMKLLEQPFEFLTTLQEESNIELLEIEACRLQQRYDEVKGTVQTVSLTQKLARM